MNAEHSDFQRLQDLAADDAVFGLNGTEAHELARLRTQFANSDANDYSPDVVRIVSAYTATAELPAGIADRVQRSATKDARTEPILPVQKSSGMTGREALAWLMASVLGIALLLVWKDRDAATSLPGNKSPSIAEDTVVPEASSDLPIEIEPQNLRDSLLALEDTLKLNWLPSKDPAALVATGDVVWNNELQQGFLTFQKLAANDPSLEQYQLWIIDAARNAAQPIDGGVFDIEKTGESVVVQINPKLQVFRPVAFAVTIEKPGGVVVSDRSRLPLLASIDSI